MVNRVRASGSGIWAIVLFGVLVVAFVFKPVHIDDANFLALAEGAAADPWRPHEITINWLGTTERAFDVLSNPPGIAWWLAPVRNLPVWVMHCWMWLWLIPAIWGSRRLGQVFLGDDGMSAAFFIATCPVVVLAAHSLTPDLPLFAFVTAGIGGFLTSNKTRRTWAFVAGCSVLFRYSGGLVIPVVMFAGWRQRRWRGLLDASFSALPVVLLAIHDLHAYGEIHLLAMLSFQNDAVHKSATDAIHNVVAGIAMLGGVGILPILVWRRSTWIGALLGAWIAANAAYFSGQTLSQAVPTALFTASGMMALSLVQVKETRNPVLMLWTALGLLLFVTVRFAATRYWIPFIPAIALLALQNNRQKRVVIFAIVANVALSLALALDDQAFAVAQRDAAARVTKLGVGSFSGHWGWQYYLEADGWWPIERNGPTAKLHCRSRRADPQQPDPSVCLDEVDHFMLLPAWWGPRVHSIDSRTSIHAGGRGNYAPWTLANDPYDEITVYRRCRTHKD